MSFDIELEALQQSIADIEEELRHATQFRAWELENELNALRQRLEQKRNEAS